MEMKIFYAILLSLAHSLADLWELIQRKIFHYQLRSKRKLHKYTQDSILERLNHITKFPRSIAIVSPSHLIGGKVSKEDSVIEKSLFIIKWASYIGVKHITFYDPEGYFVARKTYFEDQIKNMFAPAVTVNFLSFSQSRNHMVQVAQQIVNQYHGNLNNNSTSKLTEIEIEERINRDFNFPEPDLLIELCPAPCLLGFHPWLVKLSEIILLPDCDGNDELSVLNSFAYVLERYNKCQKRVGR